MIKYNYFDQDRFVIISYSGTIHKAHLVSFMDFLYRRTNKISLVKALSDFRSAEIAFDLNDLRDILKLRVEYSAGFSNSLQAVYLVQESKETAFTTFYSNYLPQNVSNVKVCSTVDYAIRHLGLNYSIQEIEDLIQNLEFEF
jgi:hypothetical protein